VRRLAVIVLPLTLAACGGASPHPGTRSHVNAPPRPRAAIRILAPSPGRSLTARRVGPRLRAVVRLRGNAAPGQQLAFRGGCGRSRCGGLTFADSHGRWRVRIVLVTARSRRTVRLAVAYAAPVAGERPADVTVRLRAARAQAAAPQPTAPSRLPAAAPYTGPRTMIVIGDSLAVGMADQLRADLPGWYVVVDGRTGRALGEGARILAATTLPAGSRGSHAILAFSLFTNDMPTNVDALDAVVRASVGRLGAHGCAIWATIARPPFGGVSYVAANQRLAALARDPSLAGRLLIVPWKALYDSHPSWRAADGVHATPEGYAARAELYAAAARACAA
jgi:lysophospholipase L1-like esterase